MFRKGNNIAMREASQNLTDAKKSVEAASAAICRIVVHKGRNRYESFEGRVSAMYENVFTVETAESLVKTFSYADVITRHVRLTPVEARPN